MTLATGVPVVQVADGDVTLTVAVLLVTEPELFVTATVYAPASVEVTALKGSVALVAPEIWPPSLLH
jgi:hypothetical protein